MYGDKRDYPKIDIFVDGNYVSSTTWASSCKEAKNRYCIAKGVYEHRVEAVLSEK